MAMAVIPAGIAVGGAVANKANKQGTSTASADGNMILGGTRIGNETEEQYRNRINQTDQSFNIGQYAPGGQVNMPLYGEDPRLVGQYANNAAGMGGSFWQEAQDPYGSMAYENQELSNREAQSRDYDQAGAMELARGAAMGQAPSAAAYQMQAGLNAAGAQQAAQAGGARGAAGLAMAQGNAASNVANMQQNAFTAAGQLRAQEMAEARGLYGGLAGQMRQQDQNRLGMGNQMSQFNSTIGLQRQMGFGNMALGANQQAYGIYNQADQNAIQKMGIMSQGKIAQNQLQAAQAEANKQRDEMANQRLWGAAATGTTAAGQAFSGMGNSQPAPAPPPPNAYVPTGGNNPYQMGYGAGSSATGSGGRFAP
jgi:hypothetical protein